MSFFACAYVSAVYSEILLTSCILDCVYGKLRKDDGLYRVLPKTFKKSGTRFSKHKFALVFRSLRVGETPRTSRDVSTSSPYDGVILPSSA